MTATPEVTAAMIRMWETVLSNAQADIKQATAALEKLNAGTDDTR